MAKPLRVYTCTDHDGHWPVGVASVIVARDKRHARRLLNKALAKDGLAGFGELSYTLQALDLGTAAATILNNGNY